MLLEIYEQRKVNGEQISSKKGIVDEELYAELKKKKEKLIQQIKTEKVINPKVQEDADNAIGVIKKNKNGYGKVGRVQYFYESVKGIYFYIHKIVEQEGMFTDTIHFYCSQLSDTMYKVCQEDDKLIK